MCQRVTIFFFALRARPAIEKLRDGLEKNSKRDAIQSGRRRVLLDGRRTRAVRDDPEETGVICSSGVSTDPARRVFLASTRFDSSRSGTSRRERRAPSPRLGRVRTECARRTVVSRSSVRILCFFPCLLLGQYSLETSRDVVSVFFENIFLCPYIRFLLGFHCKTFRS